jgi:hypothetical protein
MGWTELDQDHTQCQAVVFDILNLQVLLPENYYKLQCLFSFKWYEFMIIYDGLERCICVFDYFMMFYEPVVLCNTKNRK